MKKRRSEDNSFRNVKKDDKPKRPTRPAGKFEDAPWGIRQEGGKVRLHINCEVDLATSTKILALLSDYDKPFPPGGPLTCRLSLKEDGRTWLRVDETTDMGTALKALNLLVEYDKEHAPAC